ncbi:sensor histidine kinase [Streptomyces sp. ISL-86]|uniref:sensor histidine kinase n=1 Tax=Streptomyces sp. ISL-86 TaxID=2819187 RepID=UPI002034AB3D|nr:histidine kinase [Streptomyces sp. ISL-86]
MASATAPATPGRASATRGTEPAARDIAPTALGLASAPGDTAPGFAPDMASATRDIASAALGLAPAARDTAPRLAPAGGDTGPDIVAGVRGEGPARALAGSGEPSLGLQVNALQALCRQVFAFRLVMIALGAPLELARTTRGGPTYLVGGAILLTFVLSYALFRDWDRFGPLLLHRWLLAVDMFFSALLLITATPESPLGFVSLCTPLLAGLVYGWRGSAVYAAVQAAILVLAAQAQAPAQAHAHAHAQAPAQALTLAALCVLAGAAGACLRGLLFRFGSASQALTETRARLAAATAVRAERDRLAREMHDSVSKTLHGLALAADALSRTTDPAALRHHADLLSEAARRAAAESRQLLTDLRRDLDAAPVVSLPDELRRLDPDPRTELRATGALPLLPAAVARHLVAVASEAVENARRHAGASRIVVEAAADESHLTLTVEDNGSGLPSVLPRTGHFGLLGMTERAAAIGAHLHIGPRPAAPGTQVRLALPLSALPPERSP